MFFLTYRETDAKVEGRVIGHILGGGCGHASWREEHFVRSPSHGLWELLEPNLATFKSGNSLDKFLHAPSADTVVICPFA